MNGSVLILEPDETIRRLIEVQLGLLGRRVAWSGAAPPVRAVRGFGLAIVDPTVPGALAFAVEAGVPVVFVSPLGPTRETTALAPRAHLTMPFGLDDLARAV